METIRFSSSVELATAYVAAAGAVPTSETAAITVKGLDVDSSATAEVSGNTQATLYINFTKGSLTNVSIKIYGSYLENPGSGDWYQEVVETDSTGVATLDAFSIVLTANAVVVYHFPIGAYKALKVTVTGSGTQTGGALTLNLGFRTN